MEIKSFTSEIEKFLGGFEKTTKGKITQILDILEFSGSDIGMPYSKSLGGGLFELRIKSNIQIRIIYCFHMGRAVLLHAFIKKTEKLPKKELDLAKTRQYSLF